MLWLFFSLLAAVFWALAAIIDKHAITDEMRDPPTATVIAGFTLFLPLAAFGIFSPPSMDWQSASNAFISGIFYALAVLLYYKSSKMEEISRVIPLIMTNSLFVLLFSTIFLGEVFTPLRYLGIFLLIGGSITIAIKKKFRFKDSVIWFALLASILYASRNVIIKLSTSSEPFFSVIPWIGLGGFTVGIILMGIHHPKLKKKNYKGIEHLIIGNILIIAAFTSFVYAVSLGFVTLVSAVISTEILFVFVIATVLSKSHTHIIKEEMRGSTLLLKAISIVMIFIGLLFII